MIKFGRVLEALNRRRLLIAAISLVTLIVALASYKSPEKMQRIEMHFIVGQDPLRDTTVVSEEERYFRWVTSEYVVFGVYDWASASSFAEEVSRRMLAAGHLDHDIEEVDENMYAAVARSQLLLGVVAEEEDVVRDFAAIASSLLLEQAGNGIPQLAAEGAAIFPVDSLDDPNVVEINQALAAQTSLPMRLGIGIFSGFFIAGLIEIFDPTIRYRESAARLKLPILGEIPKA